MIQPFPLRTRAYRGETVDSYAPRLAARNYTDVADTEGWLRREGHLTSRDKRDPARLAAWRAIGALHDTAFTQPRQVNGNWVTDRELCHRCAPPIVLTFIHPRPRPPGMDENWALSQVTEPPMTRQPSKPAYGRLPDVGRVCVRHRRWLGTPQRGLHDRPDVVAAERVFRRALVPRGVTFDAPVMRLALETAAAATDPDTVPASVPFDLAAYPLQVRFARLLTDSLFLTSIVLPPRKADGTVDFTARNATIQSAVARVLPDADDEFRYRAEGRIQTYAHRLTRFVLDNRTTQDMVLDDQWNLTRYLSPDLPA